MKVKDLYRDEYGSPQIRHMPPIERLKFMQRVKDGLWDEQRFLERKMNAIAAKKVAEGEMGEIYADTIEKVGPVVRIVHFFSFKMPDGKSIYGNCYVRDNEKNRSLISFMTKAVRRLEQLKVETRTLSRSMKGTRGAATRMRRKMKRSP
jgi:hypothetical protein